jgi:hypothetical protein
VSYSIFISHSSADNAAAERLKRRLQDHGYEAVFLDFDPESGITAGREWTEALFRYMAECAAVVLLCSPAAMDSKWVFAEIVLAVARGKSVIPVLIADCSLPELLSRYQRVDLRTGADDAFGRILRGLRESGADPEVRRRWDSRQSPYPGLAPFDERDAAVFFGRRRQVREVIETLETLRAGAGSGADSCC